jgi:predicted acylesterase/phospholipase RssA
MSTKDTFYVGLCMAGAVSAGAYTAGVMDYLVETLDEWEKQRGKPGIPKHRVVIPIMGGASAGGMTSVIAAAALHQDFEPVRDPVPVRGDTKIPSNPFYHTWVDLLQDDMFSLMLATDDLAGGESVSLMNSRFIDKVADRIVSPFPGLSRDRQWADKNLRFFVTLTNLRGFTYDLSFNAETTQVNKYYISRHNDYGCFILNKKISEYDSDGWIPVNFRANQQEEYTIGIVRDAAMATGAFPVGLRPRKFTRPGSWVNDNKWFRVTEDQDPAGPGDLDTLNVDGGMINNEPFERVRELLNGITGEGQKNVPNTRPGKNSRFRPEVKDFESYDHFASTVLMIDPFPAEISSFDMDERLKKVVGKTFSAMMGQLRTKPDDIIKAMDSNNAGQYLIAPTRTVPDLKTGQAFRIQGSGAIACGSLGGFGGFLNKDFRIHDYFLGRRNCEKFLRDQFTVPADTTNEVFRFGYEGIDVTPFKSKDGKLQIIPVLHSGESIMPQFHPGLSAEKITWPFVNEEEITRYFPQIHQRTKSIIRSLFNKWWIGLASPLIRHYVSKEILKAVTDGLGKHNLIG